MPNARQTALYVVAVVCVLLLCLVLLSGLDAPPVDLARWKGASVEALLLVLILVVALK